MFYLLLFTSSYAVEIQLDQVYFQEALDHLYS